MVSKQLKTIAQTLQQSCLWPVDGDDEDVRGEDEDVGEAPGQQQQQPAVGRAGGVIFGDIVYGAGVEVALGMLVANIYSVEQMGLNFALKPIFCKKWTVFIQISFFQKISLKIPFLW